MSPEAKVIVCGSHAEPRLPGSVPITATCGHEVMVSRTTLDLTLQDPNFETRCLECVGGEQGLRASSEQGMLMALPGARGELSDLLGKGFVDALFRELGVREDG